MVRSQTRFFVSTLPAAVLLCLANTALGCGLMLDTATDTPLSAPLILASSVTDGTSNTLMVGVVRAPAAPTCSASACDGSVRVARPTK